MDAVFEFHIDRFFQWIIWSVRPQNPSDKTENFSRFSAHTPDFLHNCKVKTQKWKLKTKQKLISLKCKIIFHAKQKVKFTIHTFKPNRTIRIWSDFIMQHLETTIVKFCNLLVYFPLIRKSDDTLIQYPTFLIESAQNITVSLHYFILYELILNILRDFITKR